MILASDKRYIFALSLIQVFSYFTSVYDLNKAQFFIHNFNCLPSIDLRIDRCAYNMGLSLGLAYILIGRYERD